MAIYSRYKLKTGEEVEYFPPIQNTDNPYLTEAAMHADQANQLEGYGYLVDGVGAFTYLGTVAGTAADYEAFGGGLDTRASNLAGDLSTAEQDGIKTKLSMEGVSANYTNTLLFDNIFGKFLGTRNQIGIDNFTLASTGNKIGATIHIHFISDGVNPINFTSAFEFLHGIAPGNILPAGNYEFYFIYKANGRVSVNVQKGIYVSESYAYSILGVNQNISFANSVDFVKPLSGAFSIGYWLKLNAETASFAVGIMNGTGRTWSSSVLKLNNGFGSDLSIFNSGGSQYIQQYTFNNKIVGVYYFIVQTYNGSGLKTGLNSYSQGVLENTNITPEGAASIATINNVGAFSIGLYPFFTKQSKDCECAMMFYANKALSQTEISEAYQFGVNGKISNFSFYNDLLDGWEFNENLISEKGTHNGAANAPIYIQT